MCATMAGCRPRRLAWLAAFALAQFALAATSMPRGELTANGSRLLRDGEPFLLRGVTYHPAPLGYDPAWDPWTDLLGPGLSDVHARDVEMLTAMGANAVRVYGVQKNYNYHGELWDMLHAANITVMAGFDIYGQFLADRGVMERVKYELRETLRANHHPAIGMWAIGNELNGAWNGWVGDPGDCAGPCLFGGDVALLYSSIDELCQVVVEWGKLCTTVLADVPVPRSVTLRTWTDDPCDRLLPKTAGLTAAEAARAELTELGVAPDAACDAVTHCALLDCLWAGYLSERSCPRFGNDYYGDATDDGTFRFGCCCGAPVAHDGVTRWVEVVEQAANLTGIGAWAANVYRGFTFGPLFQTYAASSGKPFVVGEYGIDAYDMTTRRENGDLQSEWVRRLMRELEANAASCVGGCASEVAAGGFVMSWSDEWHKGHDIVQACATDGTDATNPRCADDAIVDCRSDWSRARCVRFWQQGYEPLGCPDYDATAHSRCGLYNRRSQPDDWLNEEWWGIAALVPCAPPPEGYRRAALRPRRLYYELQRAWAGGVGCVVHDPNGTALPPPPFDPISYPDCAAAVAAAHTDLATLLTGDLYGRLPFTDEVIDETILRFAIGALRGAAPPRRRPRRPVLVALHRPAPDHPAHRSLERECGGGGGVGTAARWLAAQRDVHRRDRRAV